MKIKKDGTIHDTVTGYDFTADEPLGRKAAIRAKCLECQGGNAAEVRRCTTIDCTLWPWRIGGLTDGRGEPVKSPARVARGGPRRERANKQATEGE